MADKYQRRRRVAGATILALGAVVVLAVASPFGGGGDDDAAGESTAARPQLPELPGGGRRIFPAHRVVGLYGHPTDDELGELGIGPPDDAAQRLLRQARAYEQPRRPPVLPAMELLASIATADPGAEGDHSLRTDDETIGRYLRAARSVGAILVLDIQPGYADFLEEARRLQRWLKEPDVSLALDPEWKVPEGTIPGEVIGQTSAAEVNEVSWWLDMLTRVNRLPQKLLLVHQFTDDMIADEDAIEQREWVAVALNVDGFGTAEAKTSKYHDFAAELPWADKGFKLFYREDEGLMTPRQVMRLRPSPAIVVYE